MTTPASPGQTPPWSLSVRDQGEFWCSLDCSVCYFFVAPPWETRGKNLQNPLPPNASSRKKVLSLVLCVAVMLSVMVLGAGAAFSDQDKIENTEAVDACSALNIIGGYEDGSFHPERNIKRSEITKMICVALNGGNEPNVSTNAVPTFNDVRGTSAEWAEGYIESCVAQGIVSGVGGGRFNPNGNVTGSQLAKMLLVALGYKSENEGFTGNAWETNVNVRASQKGLYEGLETLDTSAAVTRDQAAQMVWNALNAYEVEYKTNLVTDGNGNLVTQITVQDKVVGTNYDKITLLSDKYEASVYEGVLVASGEYGIQLPGASSAASAGKDKLTIQAKAVDGAALTKNSSPALDSEKTFKYAKDLTDMMGQYIKVVVDNKGNAYGVFPVEDENLVVSATFDKVKLDSGKIKVDGNSYNYNDSDIIGIKEASNNTLKISELTGNYAEVASGDVITFISNDGDSKIDLAIVNPMKSPTSTLAKVTYISSTEFVAGGQTYKFDDVTAPDKLAKGDYVAFYENTYTGNKEFIKATAVSGKVTSTKGNPVTDVKIGDNWYVVGNTTSNRPFDGALTRSGDAIALNDTVTVQVVNGVIYNVDVTTAGSTDTALVLAAPGSMTTNGNYQVKLLFADGKTQVVEADQEYTELDGDLVTWEISDDVYELTEVSAANLAGGDTYATKATGFVKSSKTVDDKKVASDATVYVAYKDGSKDVHKVLTGEQLNALGDNFGTNVRYVVKDGLIVLAYITSSSYLPGAGADQMYGYVVSSVTENNVDGVKYKQYDVFTTDGKLVEGVMQKATTAVAKGDYIKLNLTSDNYAEGVSVLTSTVDGQAGALLNSGSDYIVVLATGGTSSTITLEDGVKYLVVNTKDVKGIGNEADLEKAAETGTTNNQYYANVSYYDNDRNGKADLVVIDTTGKWYKKGTSSEVKVTQTDASNPSKMEVATATGGNSLTVSSSPITISDGGTVALTGYTGSTNKFDVALTGAASTTATMTLEGDILKDGTVIVTSNADAQTKTGIEVTGVGSITGKIVITESGKATKTINFKITVAS